MTTLSRAPELPVPDGPSIPRRPAGVAPPPSFAQERMWFLEQFAPGTSAYAVYAAVRLRGPLDLAGLAAAVRIVVARHDSLRMCFPSTTDGEPVVEVHETVDVPWRVVEADPAQARELLAGIVRQPFDLAVAPLLRVTVVRLADQDHVLHVVMHHIITDGWSTELLLADLAAAYAAQVSGTSLSAAPVVRYGDYAAWQRERLAGPAVAEDIEYWRSTLDGVPSLELPTDRPRPAQQRAVGASIGIEIDAGLTSALRELARAHRVSLFMVLLSGLSALLSRYSDAEDFAVGTPVAGRVVAEIEDVVGLFVNTLAIRADLSGSPSFAALLRRTRSRVLGALAHQELPFERLVQELAVPRDVSRSPVFQVMFALQNYENSMATWPDGLRAEPFDLPDGTSRFDLSLYLTETGSPASGGGLTGWIAYNTDLFAEATVARLSRHLIRLLAAAVARPEAPVSELELLDTEETARLLSFGRSAGPAPQALPAATLGDLVHEAVVATPEAPAVVSGSTTLTYRDLDRAANRLAHVLRGRGVGPEARVGICMEQSADVAVAVLAVLRSGGAYLPIDPEQPVARLAHVLADAEPVVVLTDAANAEKVGQANGSGAAQVLDLSAASVEIGAAPESAPAGVGVGAHHAAYVIYTSGSTGRPKGVVVAHAEVLRYLAGVRGAFGIEPAGRYALLQSLAFDFSITIFYLALATGGQVHLVPRRGTGPELADYLRQHEIDYLKITPSHLAALAAEAGLAELVPARALILGGEASPLAWAGELAAVAARRGASVFNHYGPTETTVGVTTYAIEPLGVPDLDGNGAGGATPIGRPLPYARVYILDRRLRPAPLGVPGEIYLGGARLARGYLNQPALTADRFVPDPYGEPGARMYRTGDLGRWDRDGRLHYLGRLDHQVKVRGYRVELGEIEAALASCPGVGPATVVLRSDRLVAYLTRVPGQAEPDAARLRRALAESLPEYMIPAQFVWLDELPRQAHGKVDRRALPEPAAPARTGQREAPHGPVETAIAAVWSEVLKTDGIGATDDFFELGGHSLLATQVVARLRRALPEAPRPIGVVDMFKHRTVRELASLMGDAAAVDSGLLHELSRPVSTAETTFVCFPYGGASAVVYQPLADALPDGYRLLAVAVPGHDIGHQGDTVAIEEVAQRCAEQILAEVSGPLVIYGHCGPGSALAIETARRVEQSGRDLAAVYVGGIFPFARPTGGLLGPLLRLRIVDRLRGDRVHENWLRSMGADLGGLDEEQVRFLVRAMRHDARMAEEYYTELLHRRVQPLRAPIISVVGERDPGVEYYQERYREWLFLTSAAGLVVLDEAGHYFLKFRADELADIMTTVHKRLAEPDPVVDLDVPWQYRAVASAPPTEAAPAPGVPPVAPARSNVIEVGAPGGTAHGPAPSMRRFLAVAAGQLVSMIGTALTTFAIPLHIYLITGSLVRFALFAVLGLVPGLLVAPFAGAIVDRSDRRTVMLYADLCAGSLAAGLAALLWTDQVQVWHLYLFVGALSIALAFQRVAYQSAIPQLVPKHFLGHANGVAQMSTGAAQLVVPLLAVGAMAAIGLGGILLVDMIGHVFAVVVLLLVRFPATMPHKRRESLLEEIAGGVRYSFGHRSFRSMIIFFAVVNIFLAPPFLLLSPLVLSFDTIASVGQVALVGGAGGILGGLVMLAWGGPRHRRMFGVLVSTLGLAAFAVVTGARPALLVIGVGAFGMTMFLSILNGIYATIVQTKVPQRFHGRVFALNQVMALSTLPLGWALFAPLATSVAEPMLLPGGALASTLGRVIGVGPGRGIAFACILFGLCIAAVVTVSLRTRALSRFDDLVPDAVPDDVVGLQARQRRLAARAHDTDQEVRNGGH